MNPPKLEICFEGYNTDQTDFYIGQLIEKINTLENNNESANNRIDFLEAENRQLRNELLILVKQLTNGSVSSEETVSQDNNSSESDFEQSKIEVNSAIRESLNSLRTELASVKDFIKSN